MPIIYHIDHARRLVSAEAHGHFTDTDAFDYQIAVWSRPDVAGYRELMDMSDVEQIPLPSVERLKELARLAVLMDTPSSASKFAIFAPGDLAFGFGRMFATYRSLDERSAKNVGVFRTRNEALAFLEVEDAATAGEQFGAGHS